MPMVGTTNTTSFARDALTATARILDALAEVGDTRRTRLTEAQELIYHAFQDAYGADELAVAKALNAVIKGYEKTGADR